MSSEGERKGSGGRLCWRLGAVMKGSVMRGRVSRDGWRTWPHAITWRHMRTLLVTLGLRIGLFVGGIPTEVLFVGSLEKMGDKEQTEMEIRYINI